MRRSLAQGYSLQKLRADVLAGLVVGVVALPLSMALAIAVGVPPQHGLYTAIIAGTVVALTGGSKYQVTGPTAAFIVILAPIVSQFGIGGLLTAGLMAGAMLVAMGVARLGRLIQYIPYPVTTGFTAGIAVVIATLQVKDALGLQVARMPDHFTDKLAALWAARGGASLLELTVAASTLALLLLLPRALPGLSRRVPAPLLAIAGVSLGVVVAHAIWPSVEVATIGSRFSSTIDGQVVRGIPPLPPLPQRPWGGLHLDVATLRALLPSAFAIAVLGAIESLLSAVIADGMTGKKHDPDAELVGLGIGNLVAPFFGGIAATGALARTATNVRSGAVSPLAAVVHSGVVLLAILALAPLVAYIPMAALAGLLLVIAYNMSEVRHFVHILRIAPKSDVAVLLVCFLLTVLFDMVIAVSTGVVLASLLFMRRMADLTHARAILGDEGTERTIPAAPGISVYEVTGPLFFGAAQKAMSVLETAGGAKGRVIIIDLSNVPAMDATGLVSLDSVVARFTARKKVVILAGAQPQPAAFLERAQLAHHHPGVQFAPDLAQAMAIGERLTSTPTSSPT